MSAIGGRPLFSIRTLVVALCVALVAMWAALGEPAVAGELATSVAAAPETHTDTVTTHHADDLQVGVPHAHSVVSDLLNVTLGVGHAHDLDADGHHHHTSGETVSVLPAHERAENLPILGRLVLWMHADSLLAGRPGDRSDQPPKR